MLKFAIHQISGWTPAVWSATLIAGLSCQICGQRISNALGCENPSRFWKPAGVISISKYLGCIIHPRVNTPMFLNYHGTLLSTSPILCGFPKCLFRVVWPCRRDSCITWGSCSLFIPVIKHGWKIPHFVRWISHKKTGFPRHISLQKGFSKVDPIALLTF